MREEKPGQSSSEGRYTQQGASKQPVFRRATFQRYQGHYRWENHVKAYFEHQKLTEAVMNQGYHGYTAARFVTCLLRMRRIEKQLCLFNPQYLHYKISVLSGHYTKDEQQVNRSSSCHRENMRNKKGVWGPWNVAYCDK